MNDTIFLPFHAIAKLDCYHSGAPKAALAFLLLLSVCASTIAAPSVQGVDLVNSVRVDRTNFDYTFVARVKIDASSYSNASFVVTSGATGISVRKSTVSLGSVDAGTSIRTQDTFIIRQDRTVPFDYKALTFTFNGTVTGIGTEATPVQIGTVTFVEQAGRPGHPATLPISSENPEAGTQTMLKADVFGNPIGVNYQCVSANGQLLSQGQLSDSKSIHADSTAYFTTITVPNQPFRIRLLAQSAGGEVVSWQSARLMTPPQYSIRLIPAKSFLDKGEATSIKFRLVSSHGSGNYVISLKLPPGFTGNTGPWDVALAQGIPSEIVTTISAPNAGSDYSIYTISAQSGPQGDLLHVQNSNAELIVK